MRISNWFICILLGICCLLQGTLWGTDKKLVTSTDFKTLKLDGDRVEETAILQAWQKLFSIASYDVERCSVAQAKIIDTNGDGIKDVIALVNRSCNSDPVLVFVVCSLSNGFVAQVFPTVHATMEGTLIDIDKDGKHELILKSRIPGRAPFSEATYWNDIYAWTEEGYLPDSEKFLESYYVNQYLPIICDKMMKAQQYIGAIGLDPKDKDEDARSRNIATFVLEDCRKALEKVSDLAKSKKARRK